jgi:DegV family protein with EDD domain
MAIRIFTDSTADITPAQARELGLEVVALRVNFGEESYREGLEITQDAFYDKLASAPSTPTTSQPTPEDFLEPFLDAKKAGEPVIAILLAEALSGTVQSATIARELADYDQIFIVDSLTTAMGLRLLVDMALTLRDRGLSAVEIAATLERCKHRVVLYAMVDTLDYLYRGGRLSRTGHFAGTLLNFKPVIMLRDSKITVVAKARGAANGIARMLDQVAASGEIDPSAPVYFGFAGTDEKCLLLRQKAQERFSPAQTRICPIGAVVGTHAGPGACAIAYLLKE